MPRPKKPPAPTPRRTYGTGSVRYVAARSRWRARLPRDAAGHQRETWHASEDEAAAWLARELSRDASGFDPASSLGQYLNYWYGLHASRWQPLTQYRYRYELATCRSIATHRLDRLRGDHVQGLLAGMLARGLSTRYVYNVGSLLRRALGDAVTWGILERNVALAVTLPEPERRPARVWTAPDVQKVLRAIEGHRFEAAYLLILYGGLRIGEVAAVRWDALDAGAGVLTVRDAEWTNAKRQIGTPKRQRVREVDLPPHVVARLLALRRAMPVPSVYLLGKPDGSRWTTERLRGDWQALAEPLGIPTLNPHAGRHTALSHLLARGVPIAEVARQAGHASPAVTYATYVHITDNERRRLRGALDGLYEDATDPPGTIEDRIEGQTDA